MFLDMWAYLDVRGNVDWNIVMLNSEHLKRKI